MRTLRWRDDTGSMPLAMLITLVAVTLSAVLTPMVLNQFAATRIDVRRVHALHAAQSGLEIVMGRLRSAHDATNKGLLDRLPCGPIEGSVGSGGPARYKVWIDYFTSDPRGHWNTTTSWPPGGSTEDPWIQLNRLTCTGKLLQVPGYALLRSVGSDSATGDITATQARWLHGTYRFKTTNENIAGGLIHAYKLQTSTDLCMDAGSGSPGVGADVLMRSCTPGASPQIWAYNPNLTITLVSTRTTTSLGLCLDAGLDPKNQTQVKLQPCGTNTLPQQQWSTNDSANLQGTKDGSSLNGLCLNVKNPNVDGSPLVTGSDCGGPYNNKHTFSLEPSAGAGAAGETTSQVVNFSQFGRCMDVTEFNVTFGYLIVWPCKQAPDASQIGWNQKFTMPAIAAGSQAAEGPVVTKNGSTSYCLYSAGTVGSYPVMKVCPTTLTPNYKWTYYGNTGVYATSYILVDFKGYCMAPTDPQATPPDFYPKGLNISKVTLGTCDGSTLQKWNAPANLLQPLPLKDIGER
jgi:Ricin-type beta-trefoil lectin domain